MITYSRTEHLSKDEKLDHLIKMVDYNNTDGRKNAELDLFNEVLELPNVHIIKTPGIQLYDEFGNEADPICARVFRYSNKEDLILEIKKGIEYAGKVYIFTIFSTNEKLINDEIKLMYWLRMAYKRAN